MQVRHRSASRMTHIHEPTIKGQVLETYPSHPKLTISKSGAHFSFLLLQSPLDRILLHGCSAPSKFSTRIWARGLSSLKVSKGHSSPFFLNSSFFGIVPSHLV